MEDDYELSSLIMAVTWLEGRLGRLVLPVPASHITEGRLEAQFVPLPTEQGTASLEGKSINHALDE